MGDLATQPPGFLTALLILAGKATLLLILPFIIARVMRGASASARHFLIAAGILMAGCLPLLAWTMPGWKLPIPAPTPGYTAVEAIPLPPVDVPAGAVQAGQPRAAAGITAGPLHSAVPCRDILLHLWFLGTAAAAGRVLLGLAAGVKRGRPVADSDSERIRELIRKASVRIGVRREIAVRVGGGTKTPHIRGIIRPVLYLPLHVVRWPEPRLMSVLLHELAHVRRGDHLLWPLANLSVAWLWFNPLAWLALAQMRREKERACDDYVVACGRCRVSYARHLLDACLSLRASAEWAPVGLQFAQRNEVRERITYMLNQGTNRHPIGRAGRLALVTLLLAVLVPLSGIRGFSVAAVSGEVSPGEREAVVATLKAFYAALSDGADFATVSERFLTADYFDDPGLTLENLDRETWMPVFNNTICCITEGRPGVVQGVRSRIASLQREGEDLVATLRLDIAGYCLNKGKVGRDADSFLVFVADKTTGDRTAIRECPVVDSLSQEVRFRFEDGAWKVSRFNDGVAIMRMDTDNPYGPIFLVWIAEIDKRTTPYGARVFKIIPRDVVPDAHNAEFVLED